MRIAIPHSLGREEVRRRIAARMDGAEEKASDLLGGAMTLKLEWTSEDKMAVEASAMGFTVPTPAGLGFARNMIDGMIREKGEKLLA